jgi:hypothetical protein
MIMATDKRPGQLSAERAALTASTQNSPAQ